MRVRISILAFLAALSALSVKGFEQYGWLCRVTLREYKVTSSVDANGNVMHLGSYTENRYFWLKYYPSQNSQPPYLSDLGLTQYRQLDGSDIPKDSNGNLTTDGSYYLVIGVTSCKVLNNVPDSDLSPLGDLKSAHNIGPIYNWSSGIPYNVNADFNSYDGLNSSFDVGSVSPLQGQSGDKFITYSKGGAPQLSSSADDGYSWDNDNGSWKLVSNSSGSSGNVDLEPVISGIDGIKSNQVLERQLLIEKLGSSGNSWVYDCKLSLSQLEDLASALGVDLADIKDRVRTIETEMILFEPVLGGMNNSLSSIDGKLSTANNKLNSIESSLSAIHGLAMVGFGNGELVSNSYQANDYLNGIRGYLASLDTHVSDILDNLNATDDTPVPELPMPDFGDSQPNDEIPLTGWAANFNTRNQQVFGTMVSWGNNPIFRLHLGRFDFVSRLLNNMVGDIPSVGSDPHMFDVDFDIPYIGHISKSFSFADWPAIPLFRTLMLWILYVFFALAIAKLFYHAFI